MNISEFENRNLLYVVCKTVDCRRGCEKQATLIVQIQETRPVDLPSDCFYILFSRSEKEAIWMEDPTQDEDTEDYGDYPCPRS